jgi:hypothetical protein
MGFKKRADDRRGGSRPVVKGNRIGEKFVPRFWDEADGRLEPMKKIMKRLKRFREDVCVDSYQRELLVQRAVFLLLRLETMEVAALQGEPFDQGVYTQAVNSFIGLLALLGLEKAKTIGPVIVPPRRP